MLIDDYKEKCNMMDKVSVPDGMGGFTQEYVPGAEFEAAIVFDNSLEARVAEKQGVSSLYTVTVDKGVPLNYHDVFKRQRDKKVFRVTSDSDDKQPPKAASFEFAQVTAEEYEL